MQTTGLTRSQRRGALHNKDRLPGMVETPLEEPEPEPAPRDPEPEHRLPYSMNLVAHFPQGANPNMKYVEKKIIHALHSTENLIKHVDVRVEHQDHFHREKPHRNHPSARPVLPEIEEDDTFEAVAKERVREERVKGEAVAPYIVKVKVDLWNHRSVVLSHPEKHAQPSLTEAVDHSAEVVRKLLREEKERDIRLWRKRHQAEKTALIDEDTLADDELEALEDMEAIEQLADQQVEKLYRAVEAAGEAEAAAQAAGELEQAAEQPAAAEEVKSQASKSPQDLRSALLGL